MSKQTSALWQGPSATSRKYSLPSMLRFRSPSPPPARSPVPTHALQTPATTYALRVLQDDQKYKLTHNHHVLRAVAGVRDLIRGDSSYSAFKSSSFERFSKGIRAIGASPNTLRPLAEKYLARNEEDYKELESVNEVLKQNSKIAKAQKVMVDANLELWMKHHGKEVTGAESRGFSEFLKNLFDALNEGSGFVTPKGLISHLISLGLADDPKVIISVFEGLFATSDLESIRMKKDQFLSLFKVKKSTDHILRTVQKYIANFPSPRSESPSRLQWMYPSFTQFYSLVKDWWREVNMQDIEVVHIRKLAQFLADKAVVGNKHEGKRLVVSSGTLFDGVYVRFAHFVNVFAPAILKSCLMNVARGMSSGIFTKCDSPLRLKMAAYERKLIFEGLKSPSPDSEEKVLFNAYCEYTRTLRAQQIKNMGKRLGLSPSDQSKSIPRIATDLGSDLREASQIARSKVFAATSLTPPRNSSQSKSPLATPRPSDQFITPKRIRPLHKRNLQAFSPLPSHERLMRDNRLHEHFTEMVNFTSEISEMMADCGESGELPN